MTHPNPFDVFLDRRGGDSQKWNQYANPDVLPLWLADMDVTAPQAVISALEARIAHGAFGYAKPSAKLNETVVAYLLRRYDWQIEKEWLVWLPGVVTGLHMASRAVLGDVMFVEPVYPPFFTTPTLSGKASVKSSLCFKNGQWQFDFAAMEKAITPNTGLFLLCHPHNPVGRAWRHEELIALAEFCERHALTICSDEIHCDLMLEEGSKHEPFAKAVPKALDKTITLMAPSKTYNIPGLGASFAIIACQKLRKACQNAIAGIVPDVNVLGLVAAQAALTDCDDWHAALIAALRAKRDLLEATIASIPKFAMSHVEATFLAWIDARALAVDNPARFFESAGVGLSDGAAFGLPGFVRLNFACHDDTLKEALARMKRAVLAHRAS